MTFRQEVALILQRNIGNPAQAEKDICAAAVEMGERMKQIATPINCDPDSWFDASNENSLAEVILRLYQNPGQFSTLAHNALLRYQEIEWKKMKQRYLETVEEIYKG